MGETESLNNPTEPKKKLKKGILYLSSIPQYMNVTRIREVFSEYGILGNVYLQLSDNNTETKNHKRKKHLSKKYVEGWVEFQKKSVAKKVAVHLNNKQVSTRKNSKHFDCIWNIKYLPGFKWIHLNERLAYEKAVRRHKVRAEITLAKKRTSYFTTNLNNKKKKNEENAINSTQNKLMEMKNDNLPVVSDRGDFLTSIFN